MPTRQEVTALIDAGHSYETVARELSITPGLAFMIATGLPADGSDGPHPDELRDRPVLRQLLGADKLGRGTAVKSRGSKRLQARTRTADRVVKSVCPYCAVGCAQNVYVKDKQVIQIEGDPDAPHSRGRLCPKGSASLQLTTGSSREEHVLYRRPHGTEWEPLDLDTAMDMVVDRFVATRAEGWEWESDGARTRRCTSIAALGGATLDNEENYLIKKLLTALGIIQIENQARVCHSSTVVGLGTSFGRGASSTLPGDLQNSDLIVLEGSNMAEAHPVAFRWVVGAKARGATVIHIDPHYSRTSRSSTTRSQQRVRLPGVRPALHQRPGDHQRGLPGCRHPRDLLRLRPGEGQL